MRILVVHRSLGVLNNAEAICSEKLINALHSVGAEVVVMSGNGFIAKSGIPCYVVGDHLPKREPLREKLTRLFHVYPESGWNWAKLAANKISTLVNWDRIDAVYSIAKPFTTP